MFAGYKVVCVTPAGRKRHLELLLPYVLRSALVDEYELWRNTTDPVDLAYINELGERYGRVRIVTPTMRPPGPNRFESIYQFFTHCTDEKTIYIRFDDDIVFVESGFFERFLQFRVENPQYFLVFPNIVNNAICTYIQVARRAVNPETTIRPWCMDQAAWANGRLAEQIHRAFLRSIGHDTIHRWRFGPTPLAFCRFSINCMAWFGADFKVFGGRVEEYEEEDLTVLRPASLMRMNCICGDAIVAHYSYYPQKEYLDSTDVLDKYEDIAHGRTNPEVLDIQVADSDLWTPRLIRVVETIARADSSNLCNSNYLATLIRQAGLQFDPRYPYGTDNVFMNTGYLDAVGRLRITNGLWQLPIQLARLLVILSQFKISRVIEIGTGAGWTTCILTAYLLRFNQNIQVTTVDSLELFKAYPAIRQILPISYFPLKSSIDFTGQKFDLALIDGDHSYRGCQTDYRAVGESARICVFHDINDTYVRRESTNEGGAPRLWRELKLLSCNSAMTYELCDHPSGESLMGFGVIIKDNSAKSKKVSMQGLRDFASAVVAAWRYGFTHGGYRE